MSNASLSVAWREFVRSLGCVVGNRGLSPCSGAVETHHVAEGSSVRNDFALVALCAEHHRGASGFHGLGTRPFCRIYRLPWETEYGLLAWRDEDAALALRRRGAL